MAEAAAATTVSVVIPAWNAGEDLDRCLAAVFRSDYPPAEVIVVDHDGTSGPDPNTHRPLLVELVARFRT